jgi:hypothetical protein
MKPYAPLATLLAAAVLRRAGVEPAFFDAMLSRGRNFQSRSPKRAPASSSFSRQLQLPHQDVHHAHARGAIG